MAGLIFPQRRGSDHWQLISAPNSLFQLLPLETLMKRMMLSVVLLVSFAYTIQAHMLFVVPAKDGQSITVVFSDSFEADEHADMSHVSNLKLIARIEGKETPVECKKAEHSFNGKLNKAATVTYGTAACGFLTRNEKTVLRLYYPKSVTAGADAKASTIGEKAALEIVPITESGKTRFQLLAKGKPIADAEATIMIPDGSKQRVKSDKDGYTASFEKMGRYGAYFKQNETIAGEYEAKKYQEIWHYATLVVDVAK
jgi:uncharacterized GH25 family protein